MHRILSMCLDAAIAALALAPFFLYLHKRNFHNKSKTIGYFLFAVYLSAMFAVVGLPDIRYVRFDANINLIPFQYMFSDYGNSLLNVLLFFPLGLFLPLFWQKFRKLHCTVFFGFCVSLLIEILQLFTFRATDINDLITNTFGTLLGWCAGRLLLYCSPEIIPSDNTRELYVVCGTTFAVMFFIHPFLADWMWICF